jgi:lysophospholipase L1-like esterase
VFVVGDSVSLGAQGAILTTLSAHGWYVTQVQRESLHTHEANAIVDANRQWIGEVVIVQLGTNDGMEPGEFTQWLDGLMGHLRDVLRVYWVNLRNFAPWVPAANDVIATATQRWPNMEVIDWNARAVGDPSLVYGDGYHLNPAGQAAFAELLAVNLDAFVAARTAPTTTLASPPTTTAPQTRLGYVPPPERGVPVLTVALAGAIALVVCGGVIGLTLRAGARRAKPQLR